MQPQSGRNPEVENHWAGGTSAHRWGGLRSETPLLQPLPRPQTKNQKKGSGWFNKTRAAKGDLTDKLGRETGFLKPPHWDILWIKTAFHPNCVPPSMTCTLGMKRTHSVFSASGEEKLVSLCYCHFNSAVCPGWLKTWDWCWRQERANCI